jgi:hypothetical protein
VYREEDTCGICRKPVDKSLPYIDPRTGKPNPLAKSVDEIVPVALGGSPTDRDNARLTHLGCNMSRGTGGLVPPRASRLRPPRRHPAG